MLRKVAATGQGQRAQAARMWRMLLAWQGLPGRRETPERGQLCGDCSQAPALKRPTAARLEWAAMATASP